MDDDTLLNTLLNLREHYQITLDEYERKVLQVREQLHHVNALLTNQYTLSSQEPAFHIATREESETPSLQAAPEALTDLAPAPDSEANPSCTEPVSVEQPEAIALPSAPAPVEQSEAIALPSPPAPHQVPQDDAGVVEPPEAPPFSSRITSMRPQYEHYPTKLAAVRKLMEDNAGIVLHLDYILRELYGDLGAEASVERERLVNTLYKGVKQGLWQKVPKELGCYTLSVVLLPSAKKK